MATLTCHGLKFQSGRFSPVNDVLTAEAALKISINGSVFTITMRTPGNEEALVRGLLFAEDMYRDLEDHPVIEVLEKNQYGFITAVNAVMNPLKLGKRDLSSRNLLSVSSCGICGNTELVSLNGIQAPDKPETVSAEMVLDMFRQMSDLQDTFIRSGGSHASAAFTALGELLTIQEDIGRHNAVDKVIGQMILDGILHRAHCLTVSGRISYEIVSKAHMAGIPVLAAVSAPSSLAVDFSKELGIALLAFCRDDKLTVYSHPEKIRATENQEFTHMHGSY
jgi:FdhD protein